MGYAKRKTVNSKNIPLYPSVALWARREVATTFKGLRGRLITLVHNYFMINTKITGRIYHVVDKTTNEIVKVGSTTRALHFRMRERGYKNKYTNHFLREVRTITSSELDWYEKGSPYCPFLWHLFAAEHIEIVRQGTFNKGPLSNKISPLVQKFAGFDGSVSGKIGGLERFKLYGSPATFEGRQLGGFHNAGIKKGPKGGLRRFELHGSPQTKEGSQKGGRKAAITNALTGWSKRLGFIQGAANVKSGLLAKVASSGGKLGGPKGMHTRWHTNRGIISSTCKFC